MANYWKFFDGETKQLLKFDTYGAKQKDEAAFISWAKGKPEYENIFSEYEQNYKAWTPFAKHRQYINEGIAGSPLVAYAASWMSLENFLKRKDN
ncbi:MAG: S46 family peptidase [Chitinophagaceae bacterium]